MMILPPLKAILFPIIWNPMRRLVTLLIPGAMICHAQNPPDAGQILQQERQKELAPSVSEEKIKAPVLKPTYERGTIPSDVKAVVHTFVLEGDITLFPESGLQSILTPFLNKELSIDQLYDALDLIKNAYKAKGYFLIKAYFPVQDITEGIVTIKIIEGKLDGIDIRGEGLRLDESYIRSILEERLTTGKPFTQQAFKKSIRFLNALPGISARGGIEKGTTEESVRIVMDIQEQKLFTPYLSLDNSGSRYTGLYKTMLGGTFNDLNGRGDALKVDLTNSYSAGKMQMVALDYSQPFGTNGLRAGIKFSYLEYALGDEFKSLDALGFARNYSLYASYPLFNQDRLNLDFKASYDVSETSDATGSGLANKKSISVLRNTLHADYTDTFWQGAYSFLDIIYHRGFNGIRHTDAYTSDQLNSGPQSYGNFQKFTFSGSRIQQTGSAHHLVFSTSGQFAMNNLDSSEKFQLGGMYGIRAYPGGEGSGNHGLKMTLESRYKLAKDTFIGQLKLISFVDCGRIIQYKNQREIALSAPNAYELAGWGIGLSTSKQNGLSGVLTIASRLGTNPGANVTTDKDSDGNRINPRIWFSVRQSF